MIGTNRAAERLTWTCRTNYVIWMMPLCDYLTCGEQGASEVFLLLEFLAIESLKLCRQSKIVAIAKVL